MSTKRENVTIVYNRNVSVSIGNHSHLSKQSTFQGSIELCDTGENINVLDGSGFVTSIKKKHISNIIGDGKMIWDNRTQKVKETELIVESVVN
jgi:hypothetical protein